MVFPKTIAAGEFYWSMKNITIIGSGNIGGNLARLLARKHQVTVGSRDPEQTGARLQGIKVATYRETVQAADIVVLAVPFPEVATLAKSLGSLSGKTIIDVINPLSADFMSLTVGFTQSAGELVQSAFPDAHVVKAFNTILASVLVKAAEGASNLPSVLIAGDHAPSNAAVVELAGACPKTASFRRNVEKCSYAHRKNRQLCQHVSAGACT